MSHRSRPQSAGPSRRERPTNSSPHAGRARQRAHARPQSAAAGRRSPVQAKFTFSQWRRKNGLSPVRGRPGSAGPGGRGGGGRGRGRTDERGRAPGPGAGNEHWPPAKSYPRPASAPATRRPMRGKALPVFSGAQGTSTMPEDTPGYGRSSPGKTSPGKTRAGLINMGPGRVKAMTLTSGTQGASKLDSYCRGSLNPFLHLLTDALLKERPHDVEAWALSFLQQRLATGAYQEPPRVEPAAQQQQAWGGDARDEGEGGGGGGTDRSSVSLQATGADVSATSMMPPPPQREQEREQEQGRGRGNQQADGGAGSATGTRVSASLGLPPAPAKLPPFEWTEAGDVVGVGYEVQVNFNRKEGAKVVRNSHLYRGRVRRVNDDGSFEVKYHDGDEEDKVLPEWVKWRRNLAAELQATSGDGLAGKEFVVGDSVLAKCDGWTQAYNGKVTRVNKDGSLGIEFEDGEQRLSVPVSQVTSTGGGEEEEAAAPSAAPVQSNAEAADAGVGSGVEATEGDEIATWQPRPIDTSAEAMRRRGLGEDLLAETFAAAELLAINVHEEWSLMHIDQGYTYHPRRDDGAKRHPCLVPYNQLSEEDKEWDRVTSQETLKASMMLGYTITPVPGGRRAECVSVEALGRTLWSESGGASAVAGDAEGKAQHNTQGGTYTPQVLPTRDEQLRPELLRLADDLAKNVHDSWASAKLGAGWKYAPAAEITDSAGQRLNALLKPYHLLGASDKVKNHHTAMATLRTMQYFGYSFVRSDPIRAGTRVVARAEGFKQHYAGTIHSISGGDDDSGTPFTYSVSFDDGDFREGLPLNAIMIVAEDDGRGGDVGGGAQHGAQPMGQGESVQQQQQQQQQQQEKEAAEIQAAAEQRRSSVIASADQKAQFVASQQKKTETKSGTSLDSRIPTSSPFGEHSTRNTHEAPRSSSTEDNPFPPVRADDSSESRDVERKALLNWIRKEVRRRAIGSSRLMGMMDANKSNTVSLGEFTEGLAHVDIDLDRDEYMRVFKAIDVDGGNNLTIQEIEHSLYSKKKGGTSVVHDRATFGTSTSHGKDNPFGDYGTRNSQIEMNSSITEENPFPEKVAGKKKGESDEIKEARKGERAALLVWLRKEIRRRKIGVSRLMQTMDANKSNTITLKEFSEGLATFDIDLDRAEYMRVFKAIDVDGGNQITRGELEETIYPNDRRTSIVHTKDNYSDSQNPFGHGATRNTQIEMNSSITEENPFPEKVPGKKKDEPDEIKEARKGEREALLVWLRREILGRQIGVPRLMQTMDANKSNTITLGEFSDGLARFDIDLDRDEYMRVFKAIDVDGGNQITRGELEETIYPHEKSTSIVHTKDDYSDSQNPFGHTSTRNTHKELNSSITADHPFPLPRASDSKEDRAEEREALLAWVRKELVQRAIGAPRLMGLCDSNRSNTITLGELTEGLAGVDIDLERDEYMRVFKAIDVDGGNQVTRDELEHVLYQ